MKQSTEHAGTAFARLAERPAGTCTISEAAEVLGCGRSTAYLLAQKWRESGGAEGLPTIRVGERSLAVPLPALNYLLETGRPPAVPR